MYPDDGIDGYPREAFLDDLVAEAASEIRRCLDRGATVQIDFTEARLSLKLDPSGGLLDAFVDLNNRVLGGLHGRRAGADRRPHVPGRRPRLHPQRRRRLRGSAAEPVPDGRRQLLHRARQRVRPGARPAAARHARDRCAADLRRCHRSDRSAHRDARRGPRARPPRRPGSSIRRTWARPTTAASRRSATTRPRPATRPSPRSRRGSRAPRWRRPNSGSDRAGVGGRRPATRRLGGRSSCQMLRWPARDTSTRPETASSPASAVLCRSPVGPILQLTGTSRHVLAVPASDEKSAGPTRNGSAADSRTRGDRTS